MKVLVYCVCLFLVSSCVLHSNLKQNLIGNFVYYKNKVDSFQEEYNLQFNLDSSFVYHKRVHMFGRTVKGNYKKISKTQFELCVLDSNDFFPTYHGTFFRVVDTLTIVNKNKIILGSMRFKKVKQ